MAEDALPKDERRQTMKRIIAILLALIMVFAFAACKSKDDNKDTTADSTQGAGADVQDTQAGGEDTTAAEAPSGDSTEAPSDDGSEAATQGQQGGAQGGQQGNKPAAEIKAPVNGSKASDGTTLASFLPAAKRASYKVDPAGVKSASCVKQGSGWKVSITLVTESGEGLTYVPKHHGSCFDTLSLTKDSFGPFEPVSTKVNYQSGTFTFVLNANGTLASINVSEPANVICKLKKGISIDADFTGTWQQQYTFAY